ncbi:MAG: hypothetical protein HYY10_03635 [Candidatus Liptonbacteria bacterium]|nr:hypothetical protein [Candidatus Liptonbacteria bacterium]
MVNKIKSFFQNKGRENNERKDVKTERENREVKRRRESVSSIVSTRFGRALERLADR